ncbi:MAG: thymidylate kinase [Myxococcota bacterium]|nr:thymidylate kinase [Myxococcota bacterium]
MTPPSPDGGSGSSTTAPASHYDRNDFLPESLKEDFPGSLIVLEGPDGSGRSTHIRLLNEWLEWQGFAVQTMGLKRSKLLGDDLNELGKNNELHHRTRVLLYATDFYDQIENQIVPALRAGFIVLADRFTLTLMARATTRGLERDYMKGLYSYAPAADLRVQIDISPQTAFHRLFTAKPALSHFEYGGDLHLAENVFDSFVAYQERLREEFSRLGEDMSYRRIAGERPVAAVNDELRAAIGQLLDIEDLRYTPSHKLRNLWDQR